ncbi:MULTISPECIES: hypothetical protein [Streptomyces]|uniref:hypothetical protein n=1 Tax=Streptomyces TaxID=1883 RepID=UPI001679DFCD|nr:MULTISPECIES: hypothetical protein [Streptomyces]MBD3580507.1 hypothetical protein [Streptomyces sp. KD18]GGT30505.1 hypothetical protein GCM10010286_64570 [Streptomyces toxytricini]
MSGDDKDLDVSKQALGQIAKGITDALSELGELGAVGDASMGRGFSKLALTGVQTGHDGLTAAMKTFCERWEWGVRSLVQQGNAFAVNVGLSAGMIHEQDQYLQGAFKILTNAGMGNPYASEDEITKKGWTEVLADNPYTQIRDADYSTESRARADANSKEAWKTAIRDANSSDILLSNQVIDAAGLGDKQDAFVEGMVGPAPRPAAQSEGKH